MQQNSLFHDSIHEALAADVAACGGVKKVACQLWPTLETTIAAAKLRSALNPEQAQKLSPEEVMTIKRLAKNENSHSTVSYEAQQLGFEIEWIEPEDERAKLQRNFIDAVDRLEQIKRDLSKNDTRLKLAK